MRIVTVNERQFFFESEEQQTFQIGSQGTNHKQTVISHDEYITEQVVQQEFKEPLNPETIEDDEGYFTERRDTYNGDVHQNSYSEEQVHTNGISGTGKNESDVTPESSKHYHFVLRGPRGAEGEAPSKTWSINNKQ